MLTEAEKGWLAGIWDGEGSIYMSRQIKRQIVPNICVGNTDLAIIAEVVRLFEKMGINLNISETRKKKSTRIFYTVGTAKFTYIKIFIEEISDYLVGEKKHKANLMLRFVNSRLNRAQYKYTDEEYKMYEDFRSPETTRETPNGEDIVHSL